jgi:uncharacterized membrane protein
MVRTPSWQGWVLLASLAVNVFLVGFLVSQMLQSEPDPPPMATGPRGETALMNAPRALFAGLPSTQRQEVRRTVRPLMREARRLQIRNRRAWQDLAEALRQDPVDEARITAILDAQTERFGRLMALRAEAFVVVASRLPGDVRERLAERLSEVSPCPPGARACERLHGERDERTEEAAQPG